MISKLQLKHFRGYDTHTLRLKPFTVVVGKNNAGKSTIVEALTLLSIVVNRFQSTNFKDAPDWAGLPFGTRGVVPSLKGMEISLDDNVFHNLSGPPASITATFDTGDTFTIYIGPQGKLFAVIYNHEGSLVTSKTQAQYVRVPSINVLPQVGPLAHEERELTPDYVKRWEGTPRASQHFRNQLNYNYQHFEEFRTLAEASWKDFRIRELVEDADPLALLVQDGEFVAEIGWMGHGLQMWLQVMWFVARTDPNSIVILDEPDVYMHPDLQRRLVRLLKGRYAQTIMATHSVEILAEVDPEDVLVVDKSRKQSLYAPSLPGVQHVIDNIGSVHNLQLTRLANAKRFLLVEGEDLNFLKHLHNTLYPNSAAALDSIPHASIGGWANWKYAIGSSLAFKNSAGDLVRTYCILDRDYHAEQEVTEVTEQAKEHGVHLHIWARKEIENYLLVPQAIQRIITERCKKGKPPTVEVVASAIAEVAAGLEETVFDGLANAFLAMDRAGGLSGANARARKIMSSRWATSEGRLELVSGKEVISLLSKWSQDKFGVALSPPGIVRELDKSEIAPEVVAVLRDIEQNAPFLNESSPWADVAPGAQN